MNQETKNCHLCEASVEYPQVVCSDCLEGFTGRRPSERNLQVYHALQEGHKAAEIAEELDVDRRRVYQIRLQVEAFIGRVAEHHGNEFTPIRKEAETLDVIQPGFATSQTMDDQIRAYLETQGLTHSEFMRSAVAAALGS